ncbi:hypothetical protein [Rhizobium sp. PL01]|uniref:hypothetical protein n=1 Tax=Rhizobium sp. PL01 TaxID=3085631 RepID=UPI002981FFEE|nr:hypothetical protein [Rhizobium sp. PL01]MDW5316124.1 hypothetical protein [Rhizobium sp. PL01]
MNVMIKKQAVLSNESAIGSPQYSFHTNAIFAKIHEKHKGTTFWINLWMGFSRRNGRRADRNRASDHALADIVFPSDVRYWQRKLGLFRQYAKAAMPRCVTCFGNGEG